MKIAFTRDKPLSIPKLEEREIWAIKALAKGEASADQQVLALEAIIKKLSDVSCPSIHEHPQVMGFYDGKAFVGKLLAMFINQPFDNLKMEKPSARRPKPDTKR